MKRPALPQRTAPDRLLRLEDIPEARVWRDALGNRRVERLGMAYSPGCGNE